jgi:hypothetical protein
MWDGTSGAFINKWCATGCYNTVLCFMYICIFVLICFRINDAFKMGFTITLLTINHIPATILTYCHDLWVVLLTRIRTWGLDWKLDSFDTVLSNILQWHSPQFSSIVYNSLHTHWVFLVCYSSTVLWYRFPAADVPFVWVPELSSSHSHCTLHSRCTH